MRKLAALTLMAVASVGANLWSAVAEARTYVSVGVGLPGVAIGVGPAYGPYGRPYGVYGPAYGVGFVPRPHPYDYRPGPYGYGGYWNAPHYHRGYRGYGHPG